MFWTFTTICVGMDIFHVYLQNLLSVPGNSQTLFLWLFPLLQSIITLWDILIHFLMSDYLVSPPPPVPATTTTTTTHIAFSLSASFLIILLGWSFNFLILSSALSKLLIYLLRNFMISEGTGCHDLHFLNVEF